MFRFSSKNMKNQIKRLKLNIKGSFQRLWTELVLKRRAKALGVDVELVKHHSMHHGEMVLKGSSEQLWKVVNSTKAPGFLFRLDRIVFEFTD
jgi:hypothetical protein